MNIQVLMSKLVVVMIVLISVGCNTSAPSVEPSTDPLPIEQTRESTPFEQPLPATSTLALTRAILATPVPSQTPSQTPALPTAVLSPTAEPTLSSTEVAAFVLNLLQVNDDCLFPCWWGATPNETTWQEFEPFLARFATEIINLESVRPNNPLETYEVHINVPMQFSPTGQLILFYTTRNGVIENIEIELGNSPTYSLPELLTKYGPPSDVWLSSYSHSRDNNLPFRTMLFYLDQGFMVTYFDNAEEKSGNIVGCPQQSDDQFIRAWLWNPESGIVIGDIFDKSPLIDQSQAYLPLEEATNIDFEDFYEIFKDVNNTSCIQTPADLWPSP